LKWDTVAGLPLAHFFNNLQLNAFQGLRPNQKYLLLAPEHYPESGAFACLAVLNKNGPVVVFFHYAAR
jgi:hypothetical protein